ncbi:helix-turn-helix transcriptional regulator [Aquincola tertiaricarbonis]|uniref:Helix-turn-helix transcriptional regulator n=1 Tax=Aquincola tertiaricarbonis TaxID=391953 RepID=A0ABY4SF20_AQUTE|nr:helix-turn-helix transcriptional regulator [Aquincola tertiaricarbonis]URI11917.1 helix-turn-helix transcriptional regulator [Aquincola tertiaricarbonis]
MGSEAEELPVGHFDAGIVVRTSEQLGEAVRARRKALGLTQLDIAGMGNTGNRFIVELEKGKPTLQLQKVLSMLDLLGLEVVVRPKTGAST